MGILAALFGCLLMTIAFEHRINLEKEGPALAIAVTMLVALQVLWPDLAVASETGLSASEFLSQELPDHHNSLTQTLFFLFAVMVIVEKIDSNGGFDIITSKMRSDSRVKFYWMVAVVAFFLSAVLDNMTTAIVMGILLKRLLKNRDDWFVLGSIVVMAANSGGAWSPIGDITTTMLWIQGFVSTFGLVTKIGLPSIVNLVVSVGIFSWLHRGKPIVFNEKSASKTTPTGRLFLAAGILSLCLIPGFKSVTGLPPMYGAMLFLGLLTILSNIVHRKKDEETRKRVSIAAVISRMDSSTLLFLLAVLTAVRVLEYSGCLHVLSIGLGAFTQGNVFALGGSIGAASSLIENVPLVASAMSMYEETYPTGHIFWDLLAYCAGTGGSILLTGSVAGIAIMKMLGMDFRDYLWRTSPVALCGYLAGLLTIIAFA